MIVPDVSVQKAMSRLMRNPDFKVFLQFLEDDKNDVVADLIGNTSPVIVHQRQGSAQTLTDIIRAATSAPEAVASAQLS